jgi:hypothetical protein
MLELDGVGRLRAGKSARGCVAVVLSAPHLGATRLARWMALLLPLTACGPTTFGFDVPLTRDCTAESAALRSPLPNGR